MSFSQHIWGQLKSITCDELSSALNRDGWTMEPNNGGSMRIYISADEQRRVSIHYHPKKTYGAKLLKALLGSTGWSEDRMRELKLCK